MKDVLQLPGFPLIGNMLAFQKDRLGLYRQIYDTLGEIGGYRLGHLQFVLLNRAEYVQWLLVDAHQDFERSPVMEMMKPIMGQGLLTSDNALNQEQRRLLSPAFHPERFPAYGEIVVRQTQAVLKNWQNGQTIDLTREMMNLALCIIGKTLFSADVFADLPEMVHAVTTMLQYTDRRLKFMLPVPLSWPLPFYQSLQKSIRPVNQILEDLIAQRRALRDKPPDLLTLLVESPLKDREIRDQLMTFLFAGHETTANALAWAFYLLAKNPEHDRTLREEVVGVLNGKPPTYGDLKNLPYALQVLKEAIRLYPPAYAFGRTALRDIALDDYRISKGMVAVVSPYMLHRRPDYFPQPDVFNPERFSHEQEERIPRFAYLPFGAGPRACIGRQFALMEAHLILTTLAQSVEFIPMNQKDIAPEPMITLRPKENIQMRVYRLDQEASPGRRVANVTGSLLSEKRVSSNSIDQSKALALDKGSGESSIESEDTLSENGVK